MGRMIGIGLAVAALGMAAPAVAGDSDDFSGCDGRMKPKSKDDGMRGEASLSGYSYLLGSIGTGTFGRIDACNRALANPKLLPTQTLRRAHLLRARAAAFLEQGKTADALADLDAAESAVADRAQDPLHRRSMGASLMLLRAIAKSRSGEDAEAARLAQEAQALRPYAVQVQIAAAIIRQTARPVGQASDSPWGDLVRIEPAARAMGLSREAEIGNFAGVVAMGRASPVVWPDQPPASLTISPSAGPLGEFAAAMTATLHLAYAQAATGDVAAAKDALAVVRTKLASLSAPLATPAAVAPAATESPTSAPKDSPLKAIMANAAEPSIRLAEARIALAEGRVGDARKFATTGPLPLNAEAFELRGRLRELPDSVPGPDLADEGLAKLAADRRRALGPLAATVLFAPETQRTLIDYQKSRPNILGALIGASLSMGTTLLSGIERTSGFRSAPNPDGTVKVEYVGNTTSGPMVQEMTLLRAAELARAANKPSFEIVERKDYSRFLVTSQYGVETSRTPTGYKTELTVRFLDAPGSAGAALDAVAVIDALGPFYYQNRDEAGAKPS